MFISHSHFSPPTRLPNPHSRSFPSLLLFPSPGNGYQTKSWSLLVSTWTLTRPRFRAAVPASDPCSKPTSGPGTTSGESPRRLSHQTTRRAIAVKRRTIRMFSTRVCGPSYSVSVCLCVRLLVTVRAWPPLSSFLWMGATFLIAFHSHTR